MLALVFVEIYVDWNGETLFLLSVYTANDVQIMVSILVPS